jgi:hypothetical protein
MNNRDFKMLNDEPQSWLLQHLIPMLPVVFSNGQVRIYNATHVSFPLPNSETTLLIPTDPRIVTDNSWLYAYDILSQSGKNYSIMYDMDINGLKSKNVVLGLDPTEYPNFYDKFSSHLSENSSQWKVISGNWRYSADGPHGGDGSNNTVRTILSPVSSDNLTANTSFRINSASPRVANYISIVYSWKDPKNYEYAGVTCYNNTVYVSSARVTNGKEYFDPAWPGITTNVRWKAGNLFNLTLSIHDIKLQEELFLNGTGYHLHRDHTLKPGYLGLSYGPGTRSRI